MKYIKLTDLLTQCILMLLVLTLLLTGTDTGTIFQLFYFVLGGWQLTSFLIQLCITRDSWYLQRQRSLYGKTVAWTIAGALLVFTGFPLGLLYLWGLIFITPLYAIWYLLISVREMQVIRMKELIHLKN